MSVKFAYLFFIIVYFGAQFFTTKIISKNEAVKNRNEDIKSIVAKAKIAYFRNRILGIIVNGWRPYFNNIIWMKIVANEDENRYADNIPLLEILTSLSPEYEEVWSYHGWNTAINISRIQEDPENSWRWIKTGLAIIAEGLKFNPASEELLTWYSIILYNRGLYNPVFEEMFLRDFKQSPYQVAADIYQQLSEAKRKINPKGIYYEGFVSTLSFMDIFFWLRLNKFSQARFAIKSSIRYNKYLLWLYREYGKMPYHYSRRIKLLKIFYNIIKKEKTAFELNNDWQRIKLIEKYLRVTKQFYTNLDFEIFKNRITLLLATILNNVVYGDKVSDFEQKIKMLTALSRIFEKFSTGGEPFLNRTWSIHKEFIDENIDIVKYEKDGKIEQLQTKVREIIKKYPIYTLLNVGKFIK